MFGSSFRVSGKMHTFARLETILNTFKEGIQLFLMKSHYESIRTMAVLMSVIFLSLLFSSSSVYAIFSQPDPNIPNPYDPQQLNRYSYARNNPYKYIDPTGNEPVLAQIGSYEIAYNYILAQETNNPNANAIQTLNSIVSFSGTFGSQPAVNIPQEGRFIYTSERGFVDVQHFLGSAAQTQRVGSLGVEISGYAVELYQALFSPHSAFSYEDIPSNRLGRVFSQNLNTKEPLSAQFKNLVESIGASKEPLKTLEKEHPDVLKDIPQKEKTGQYLPENKVCYICAGQKALPISSGGGGSGIPTWKFFQKSYSGSKK